MVQRPYAPPFLDLIFNIMCTFLEANVFSSRINETLIMHTLESCRSRTDWTLLQSSRVFAIYLITDIKIVKCLIRVNKGNVSCGVEITIFEHLKLAFYAFLDDLMKIIIERVVRTELNIYVFVILTESIPLLVDY